MTLNTHVITKSKNNLLKINDNDYHDPSLNELRHKSHAVDTRGVLLEKLDTDWFFHSLSHNVYQRYSVLNK